MPSPPAYNQTTDFSNDEAGAVAGRSTVRTANHDTEFVNIEATLDQIVANLALSQSSDGSPLDDWVDLPSLAPDAITWISTNGNGWYATDTGTVNTMVVTLDPAATALTNGMFVVTDIKLTNTATAVTLNVNGLGAKVVVTNGAGTVPAIGALTIGTFYGFQYDLSADKFQIVFSGDSMTHSVSAEASAAAAAISATAAAASYDSFDDRYLGTKSSDPSVDNDGATLLDGALYFNTSTNVMMVYDLGGTAWNRTTPTSADQTKINTVSGIAANVTTVAGISANVTTVAGISSDIATVAADASDIGAVAADSADIGAVAAKATEIGRLGTADAVADMAILGTADVVTDMNVLGTADVVTDMNTLGTADVVTDMNVLGTADVVNDMHVLGTSGNVTNMNTLSAISSDITAVAGKATEVGRLGTAAAVADLALLGETAIVADMALLAIPAVITDMDLLGATGVIDDLETCSDNLAGISNFAARYRVASSDPVSSLDEGDLAYNSTANVLKYYNGSAWVTIVAGSLTDVVQDGSPQLGADLDLNGHNIDFPTTVNVSDCIDDDTFGTASATKLATSESIKAYVDAIEASEITTAGVTFSNYNTIAGNATTTTASTKNMFLFGVISVTGTAVWTIAGNGVLTII